MTSHNAPFESHVQSLFCFALGVLSGVQAANRLAKNVALDNLNVPETYVFAGSGLDTLAGDAFMRSGMRWFIIEMKRTVDQLDAELEKTRVLELRDRLKHWRASANAADQKLWKNSICGHAFIYGCHRSGGGLAIAARSYPDWLVNRDSSSGAIDFVEFIDKVSNTGNKVGFTWKQLVEYLASMNDKSGAPPSDDRRKFIDDTFTVAIDPAGQMTTYTLSSVMDMVKRAQMRAPLPQQQSTLLTQSQTVAPPSPWSSGPGL